MELNQLHYFLAVAKTENVTKAAQELFITQPALSRVILRLEKELGTTLFDRKGGRLVLNDRGKVFLSYIKPALEAINNGVHTVIDGLGTREIVIHNYLITNLFNSITEKCQAEFPTMSFTVKNIGDYAKDKELTGVAPDIVMLPTNNLHAYIFHTSYTEQWCVTYNDQYGFHDAVSGRTMTLAQLAKEPIVFFGSDYDRLFVEQLFAKAGLAPNIIYCESLHETSSQINRCRAVGFVPVSNFRALLKSVEGIPVSAAAICDTDCSRTLYLGRSIKFLSNADEYKVLESVQNYISCDFAETDKFYQEYFFQNEKMEGSN